MLEKWESKFDKGKHVVAASIDLSKAFDTKPCPIDSQKQPSEVFNKKRAPKNFTKLIGKQQWKTSEACSFTKKETLAHVFFFKFREISKNTFS